MLLPPKMREAPLGPSEEGVPERVRMLPGARVWDAMTRAEERLAVIIEPPIVAFAGMGSKATKLGRFVCAGA